MSNIIGDLYKVITFGESHGIAIGCVIEGCPSGISINLGYIQYNLNRRRPGTSKYVTQRHESDMINIISGVFNGITTGTPIGCIVYNFDHVSSDYDSIMMGYRPGHADYPYCLKYGIRDHRGGGRTSARTTIALVIAGSLACQINLEYFNIKIFCYISSIGNVKVIYNQTKYGCCDNLFLPCSIIKHSITKYLDIIKTHNESVGSCITLIITNIIVGLGEPLYNKFTSELVSGLIGLNAVKSVEFGLGNNVLKFKGSDSNDNMYDEGYLSNCSGGVLGGLSTGQDIRVRIYIKPTSSISKPQLSVDSCYRNIVMNVIGRHDPCVGIRAVPIIESITSIVLFNLLLRQKIIRFF